MSKRHIIITKLFEFGGSNEHLQTLVKYLGSDNIVLVLGDDSQLNFLKNIPGTEGVMVAIKPHIHPHAHLQYKFTTNIKELFYIIRSIFAVQLLSLQHGRADITICAVEPEKHLYLLWMPFSKVYYVLHTTPYEKHTPFTSYTCNKTLGDGKRIITVSRANKNTICKNWDITADKSLFVNVIYNCINQDKIADDNRTLPASDKKKIITLGQVIGYKNPQMWLKVAESVTTMRGNIVFEWLGNGPLLTHYQALTQDNERIVFKGLITKPGSILREATIYYQPSQHETHGIAVVEAMSCGLPCVVSKVGGMPESVLDGHNGLLVDVANVDEHVNAIIKLIDSRILCDLYGQNSYNRYLELFTYASFKTEMDKIYA